MRDLSLHLLDLLENSLNAGASRIRVELWQSPVKNRMHLILEDNGCGLKVPPSQALDPFHTTKPGKRTGLGLSLYQATVERAKGRLDLSPSRWGGLKVSASFVLDEIDRIPLGDIAATLSTVVCTQPTLELECVLAVEDKSERILSGPASHEAYQAVPWRRAQRFAQQIQKSILTLGVRQ